MTYEEFFSEVKAVFATKSAENIKEHIAYQFNITGAESGVFYVEIKDGQIFVEPYDYHDRDALFTCSADTLRKIAAGKLDPIVAVTLQKLKFEGNIDKALKLKEIFKG